MKIKLMCLAVNLLLFLILGATGGHAYTIHLDGIANAGSDTEDLTKTYLYIQNPSDGTYYYEWTYGEGTLPWVTLNDLVTDLNDGTLNEGVPNPVSLNGWYILSGGDVFDDPSSEIWKSISLSQGWYELNLAFDSEAYNLRAFWQDNWWNAYVQLFAKYGEEDGENFSFGSGSLKFDTEALALEHYRSYVDGMTIYLAQSADLYFYINDINAVDNAGSVTLDIHAASIPEPATLFLLFPGVAGLIVLRRWAGKKSSLSPGY